MKQDHRSERLETLLNTYNKLADHAKHHRNPSLYDVLMMVVQNHFDDVEGIPDNILIAAIFMMHAIVHDLEEDNYIDRGLRKLRVRNRFDEVLDVVNTLYGLIFDMAGPRDRTVHQEILADARQLLEELGIDELQPMPTERPYRMFLERLDELDCDITLLDEVEGLCFELFDFDVPGHMELIYNLILAYPFAHGAMTMFLDNTTSDDQMELSLAIIKAFQITHPETVLNPPDDFYDLPYHNEYLLALENLGFIYRDMGEFEKAVETYQEALRCDRQDHLHIKEALLLPYIYVGDYDAAYAIRDQLEEHSLYATYFDLYDDLIWNRPIYESYNYAKGASPLIMEMLAEDIDLFDQASEQERQFINDFYDLFVVEPELIEQIRLVHNEDIKPS